MLDIQQDARVRYLARKLAKERAKTYVSTREIFVPIIYEQKPSLTLYLIETPFNPFANRADPDQAALVRAA